MRLRLTVLLGGLLALSAAAPAVGQGGPSPPSAAAPTSPPPGPGTADLPLTAAEMRELIGVARLIAKSTRETTEYTSVMPDLLTQILTKLDKLEDKLDKIEDSIKRPRSR